MSLFKKETKLTNVANVQRKRSHEDGTVEIISKDNVLAHRQNLMAEAMDEKDSNPKMVRKRQLETIQLEDMETMARLQARAKRLEMGIAELDTKIYNEYVTVYENDTPIDELTIAQDIKNGLLGRWYGKVALGAFAIGMAVMLMGIGGNAVMADTIDAGTTAVQETQVGKA